MAAPGSRADIAIEGHGAAGPDPRFFVSEATLRSLLRSWMGIRRRPASIWEPRRATLFNSSVYLLRKIVTSL